MVLRRLSAGGLPVTRSPNLPCWLTSPNLTTAWNNLTTGIGWRILKGLYWICGERAYTILPKDWFGFWVLGTIWPSFFLFPLRQGKSPTICYPQRVEYEKKFNLSNCCLQIDDKKKIIKKITAHVPVQTWKGWSPNDLFKGWFSTLSGFKTLISTMFLALQSLRTIMEATIKKKDSCSCNCAREI
jgi:hypothetical protein